ncbi:MAG: glycosyltransferase family 2 protein [Deltaproteobacteria bacterium]|nr:glycosyltransferase family 2 protein [Deltaproteobacteria bacterium]
MKISVCLASYNGEKFIFEQINSIISQLDEIDELIISDDSSTDMTLSIIKGFNDSRIKLFPGNTFYNPVYNFENALKQSAGEVIVLSDQDDIWLENKLPVIRQRFNNKPPNIYTIVLDGQIIDENGTVIKESIFETLGSGKGIIKNLIKNTYMGCCMIFTRDLLEKVLPFPKGIPMHDSWIGLLSELYGVVEFVPMKTIQYRRHSDNRSLRGFSFSRQIRWRYALISNLVRRWLEKKSLDLK